jgi:hypothetical protein
MAAGSTAEVTGTIRFIVAVALLDGGSAALAYALTHEVHTGRVFIVIGAAIVGTVIAVAVVFLWFFLRLPRQLIEIRLMSLEETVQGIRDELARQTEEKWGDPFQFLAIYHTLRTDVREAIRALERAEETGKLWSRTGAPDYREWKKQRKAIATNPYARLDGLHGMLLEAFDHVERLSTNTSMRIGARRRVRETDDIPAALGSLRAAEDGLTFAIDRLEGLQSPLKPGGEQAG